MPVKSSKSSSKHFVYKSFKRGEFYIHSTTKFIVLCTSSNHSQSVIFEGVIVHSENLEEIGKFYTNWDKRGFKKYSGIITLDITDGCDDF